MKSEKRWYALYTAPRAERKVADRLDALAIDYYLPMHKVMKQWSDRKKRVEEPLFKSYIFVNISEKDYFNTLNITGAVRFVTFGGKAASIPEKQIETIKRILLDPADLEVTDLPLEVGTPVEVIAGPLMGTMGEIVSHKGEKRVAIKIESIERALIINVPQNYCEELRDPTKLQLFESTYKTKFA